MEIKTKFALGEKVWTVDDCKATEIEVAAITIDAHGVWLRSKAGCASFREEHCFPSKQSLVAHIEAE